MSVRENVHGQLCALMATLEQNKDIRPLMNFVMGLRASNAARTQIFSWVQRFSPFSFSQNSDETWSAKFKRKRTFDVAGARELPYWKLRESDKHRLSKIRDASHLSSASKDVQKWIKEHSHKEILKSVRSFLESPDDSSLNKIVVQLKEYKEHEMTMAGVDRAQQSRGSYVRVVSGGLPSLGRHAK